MQHDDRFICTGFLRKRNTKAWKLVRLTLGHASWLYHTVGPPGNAGVRSTPWPQPLPRPITSKRAVEGVPLSHVVYVHADGRTVVARHPAVCDGGPV
jgi:hypothetical protein